MYRFDTTGCIQDLNPGQRNTLYTPLDLQQISVVEGSYSKDVLSSLFLLYTRILRIKVARTAQNPSGGWASYDLIADYLTDRVNQPVHLDSKWRESQGDELKFAILGMWEDTSMREWHILTMVLDQNNSNPVTYRAGIAEIRHNSIETRRSVPGIWELTNSSEPLEIVVVG
jgi:hypothetical protein